MKTLYIDCSMGAAGDMLSAALLELLPKQERKNFIDCFNSIGIPGVRMEAHADEKHGITGTHVHMLIHGEEEHTEDIHHHDHDHEHHHDHDHDHEHHLDHDHDHEHERHHDHDHDHDHHHHHHHEHHSMQDIENMVSSLQVDAEVKSNVLSVYQRIAAAEGKVHGKAVSEIHFHEVGAMDAVADVTAVCMLMHEIAPEKVIASPMTTGFGSVRCAHGVLSVPAPATSLLLHGIPITAGDLEGELCTPTGAALVGHFANEFGRMPVMTVSAEGFGMGTKNFPRANCLRVFLGETVDDTTGAFPDKTAAVGNINVNFAAAADVSCPEDSLRDHIIELSCNIDDMTAEEIGFATERLMEAGAKDVYTAPIYMKKNRPGTLLCVLCAPDDREALVRAIFRYTTTIGIRECVMDRYVLKRQMESVETEEGILRRKKVFGYGVERSKSEYEDLAQMARKKDVALRDALKE